jgi:chromate transporter
MPEKSHQEPGVQSVPSIRLSSPENGRQPAQGTSRPTLWSLFLVWGKISIQSFGGGSSTLLLMRQEFVEKRQWLTIEEYTRFWGLSQLSPGIILLGMSLLMGRRLAGTAGMVVSLVGILLPSAAITVLLTAGFALIQSLHSIQAMIQGVLPATAGIMLALSIQFAHPLIRQSFKESAIRSAECLFVIAGSTLALVFFHLEAWIVLLGAAFLCIAVCLPLDTLLAQRRVRQKDEK